MDRKTYTLTWTNTGVATDVAPDTDTIIDVEKAVSIYVQADTTNALNTSTDWDTNVMASYDGLTFTSVPFAEKNQGDDEIVGFLVNPGMKSIRLRGDNNALATTGYVTAHVTVREKD